MSLKVVAFAFAVALLMFMGFALSDGGENAEASIDPIVESECAKQDSQSGNSGTGSRTAGNDQHPPGQTPGDGPGDGKGDLKGVRSSDDNAKKGQGGAHCKNLNP